MKERIKWFWEGYTKCGTKIGIFAALFALLVSILMIVFSIFINNLCATIFSVVPIVTYALFLILEIKAYLRNKKE